MAPAGYGNRVEGLHAVAAAVEAGRVRRLWVESGRLRRPEVRSIMDGFERQEVSVVEDVRSLAETDAPQGLIADCIPIAPIPLDRLAGGGAAIMVLDHIEDPHNVGAIARSSLAAGMTGMMISAKRQAPLSAAAFKTAAGALEKMPVAVVGSIAEALNRLKAVGVWIVGLEPSATSSLFGLEILTEPVAVVIGAEGAGLGVLTARRCDVLASIAMAGATDSLNASVSAALACFEIMRVRRDASAAPG
ncbi:MAG: TrmH family RNA methyltransferase [Acidimicrobiia bacterium]